MHQKYLSFFVLFFSLFAIIVIFPHQIRAQIYNPCCSGNTWCWESDTMNLCNTAGGCTWSCSYPQLCCHSTVPNNNCTNFNSSQANCTQNSCQWSCAAQGVPTPTPTPTPVIGQNCDNSAGKCVPSAAVCNPPNNNASDCGPNQKCVAETAACSLPTPIPRPTLGPTPTPMHPRTSGFTPLKYSVPCSTTTRPEFHPLRPYPASPCDPLIPQKVPEAKFAVPAKDLYLSFRCSPSTQPSGTYTAKDVVYGCGMPTFPANYKDAVMDKRYICPDDSSAICFLHEVRFNVALNYQKSQLPVAGNTQDFMLDADRINDYLASYLNGTVLQAERPTTFVQPDSDIYRLVNFSGPVKKLLSSYSQQVLHSTLGGNGASKLYHNYIINKDGVIITNDSTRIKGNKLNAPNEALASQEDITSEVVVSLPTAQPTDMDGFIVPNTIALSIASPSDSRLYFPHLRNSTALSEILASTARPGYIYRPYSATQFLNMTTWTYASKIYPPISADSSSLVSQNILLHQGMWPLGDTTKVQTQYNGLTVIRNTEVREGALAPARLYDSDPMCSMNVSNKPGDDLVGSTVNTVLTYTMYFKYRPQLLVNGAMCGCDQEGQSCSSSPNSCCWGTCPDNAGQVGWCAGSGTPDGRQCNSLSYSECQNTAGCSLVSTCQDCYCTGSNTACDGQSESMCKSLATDPDYSCVWTGSSPLFPPPPKCPTWPNRELLSQGRIAVYTKTPQVERVYDTLVASSSSVLHRFMPYATSATVAANLKTGRETNAVATSTEYSATGNLNNVKTMGPEELYFSHLGSLFDHFLGNGSLKENLNIQCFFRPKGSCAKPVESGLTTCDQNAPAPAGGYASLGLCGPADYATKLDQWFPGGKNWGKECYNDVIRYAQKNGLDPAFVLSIWWSETGGSNYQKFGLVWDFGVTTRAQNNFVEQITEFVLLPNRYINTMNCGYPTPLENFTAWFLPGTCDPNKMITQYGDTRTAKDWIATWITRLNSIWTQVKCDGSTSVNIFK